MYLTYCALRPPLASRHCLASRISKNRSRQIWFENKPVICKDISLAKTCYACTVGCLRWLTVGEERHTGRENEDRAIRAKIAHNVGIVEYSCRRCSYEQACICLDTRRKEEVSILFR